jgi:hypothetical protein
LVPVFNELGWFVGHEPAPVPEGAVLAGALEQAIEQIRGREQGFFDSDDDYDAVYDEMDRRAWDAEVDIMG